VCCGMYRLSDQKRSLTPTIPMSLVLFEDHKYINKYNQPYWKARELAKILEYVDYRKFLNVITKAKKACENS